jgi:hypothetical protein
MLTVRRLHDHIYVIPVVGVLATMHTADKHTKAFTSALKGLELYGGNVMTRESVR